MSAAIEHKLKSAVKLTPTTVLVVNVLVIAVFVVCGWPEWWKNINYERSPLTWFSSVQLTLIGTTAFLNFLVSSESSASRLWFCLGGGFFYLSVDEMFQIHERLREGVFKPHGIGTHLPGIGPGDFLLIIYAVIGLFVARRLFSVLRTSPVSFRWFVTALVVSAVAVGLDAVNMDGSSLLVHRVEQFFEEILETIGEMSFLISFLTYYLNAMAKAFVEET